jgi:hypothetical protein
MPFGGEMMEKVNFKMIELWMKARKKYRTLCIPSMLLHSTVLLWLQTVIVIIRPCKLPVPATYSRPKIGIVFLLKF